MRAEMDSRGGGGDGDENHDDIMTVVAIDDKYGDDYDSCDKNYHDGDRGGYENDWF